jgi:FAD/FMN-containing dehydrogenase
MISKTMDEFISKLRDQFSGDILYDALTLEKYSRDASLFKIKPELVVFPKTVKDIENLVKTVNEERIQGRKFYLTPRSGGTDMTGGPLGESIVVEFTKYFNHVKEIGKDFAITEPGVFYRDFDHMTQAKFGTILPSYPASREIATVGGMAANNSGGEKNLRYGKTENYIQELHVVLQDQREHTFRPLTMDELDVKKSQQNFEGELYRRMYDLIERNYDMLKAAKPDVSKNSAGYYLWNVYDKEKGIFDLTKLLCGSQGTLGIFTEIKYKLIKPNTHSCLLVLFLKDMKQLGDITNVLLKHKPESIESYDDHTFRLAVKLFPQLLARMKGNFFKLMWDFIPEFWAVLTGGIPKLVVMAEFTSDTDILALSTALEAEKDMKQFHIKTHVTHSPEEVSKYWVIRRESFSLLRKHVKKLRTAPFIDDMVVKPEFLPQFLPRLYKILDQYNITYTIAGHVGDGNFHIIPLMDFTKKRSKEIVSELIEKVNSLIIEFKGSITGEHNDGIVRTPYLERMYGTEVYKLFQEVKRIFDPQDIFNPGKKVDGTWEYALKHIDSTGV